MKFEENLQGKCLNNLGKRTIISILLMVLLLPAIFADESDTQVRVIGSLILLDPSSDRQIEYKDWATMDVLQLFKTRLLHPEQSSYVDDTLRFIRNYIGRRVSNDTRTMIIREGVVTAYYGKYIVVYDPNRQTFYINIILPDLTSAYRFRAEQFPRSSEIPYGVCLEIWTEREDIIGRDRVGDYEDLL